MLGAVASALSWVAGLARRAERMNTIPALCDCGLSRLSGSWSSWIDEASSVSVHRERAGTSVLSMASRSVSTERMSESASSIDPSVGTLPVAPLLVLVLVLGSCVAIVCACLCGVVCCGEVR